MIAILQTELYKLIKQGKTWYAVGAVLILEFIILGTAYFQGATILDLLLENLKDSFYFEGDLLNGNLLLYVVLNSLWFNLPIILIIITSALITEDYKNGSLQTTMLQAVPKWKFILAKYITSAIFTFVIIGILMSSTFALAYGLFGSGDLIVYLGNLNFFQASEAFQRICLAFASGTLSMLFFTTASITIGILLKDPAKTWIASAFFLILCSLLLKLNTGLGKFEPLFFPKLTNTWQQFFNYELNWTSIYLNNLLLLLYTAIFAGIGMYIFQKKDIG